jgi:pimeloyl-ACP methyl ester carboxylesterase
VLVIAGDRDRVVPLEQSQRLHAAIPHPESRLLVIPGADHNDFDLHTGPRAIAEVTSFIDSALPS